MSYIKECDSKNIYKMEEEMQDRITNNFKENIQIIKEQKQILDLRLGMLIQEPCAPKYYFADKNGNKLPIVDLDGKSSYEGFYSIEKIDGIHYKISSLDFTYSPGLDSYLEIYGRDFKEAFYYFRFHYGIVAVHDNKISLVVPTVYKDLKLTNSNVIISQADDTYKPIYKNGEFLDINKIDGRFGAINLDSNSESYGMNIMPTVFDRFEDFDLTYKGFAHVSLDDCSGYVAKEIDIQRYNEYLRLLSNYKEGKISIKEYQQFLKEAISKVLFSDKEMIEKYNEIEKIESKTNQLVKKPKSNNK